MPFLNSLQTHYYTFLRMDNSLEFRRYSPQMWVSTQTSSEPMLFRILMYSFLGDILAAFLNDDAFDFLNCWHVWLRKVFPRVWKGRTDTRKLLIQKNLPRPSQDNNTFRPMFWLFSVVSSTYWIYRRSEHFHKIDMNKRIHIHNMWNRLKW